MTPKRDTLDLVRSEKGGYPDRRVGTCPVTPQTLRRVGTVKPQGDSGEGDKVKRPLSTNGDQGEFGPLRDRGETRPSDPANVVLLGPLSGVDSGGGRPSSRREVRRTVSSLGWGDKTGSNPNPSISGRATHPPTHPHPHTHTQGLMPNPQSLVGREPHTHRHNLPYSSRNVGPPTP